MMTNGTFGQWVLIAITGSFMHQFHMHPRHWDLSVSVLHTMLVPVKLFPHILSESNGIVPKQEYFPSISI